MDPDGEGQEDTASDPSAAQPQPASVQQAVSATQQNSAPAGEQAPEKSGADMIAEIEQELKKNDTPTARLRAIRKFKDLNKKGFMSEEELNRRMDELMGFDDEEEETVGTENTEPAAAEDSTEEEEMELL